MKICRRVRVVRYSVRVTGSVPMIGVVQSAHLATVAASSPIYNTANCGWYFHKNNGNLFSGGPSEAKSGVAYGGGPVADGSVSLSSLCIFFLIILAQTSRHHFAFL
eukprot:TRINITY_DN5224_c0_g1_i17.p2 TRINITY_DN5224_c0_g1~~TRINITY_DN5224_c0_g1_i17.p2  ORF type:complete len:106 (-),score=24.19 TRINITY_DN5224_c0_g1_i17:61-378(-)